MHVLTDLLTHSPTVLIHVSVGVEGHQTNSLEA